MQHVYVIGGAGSGKTTLAIWLASRFGLPHFELDIGERPLGSDDGWIVEGAFVWDVEPHLALADTIVWLDLPLRVTVPRILRRHAVKSIRRTNRHRGMRRLADFVRFQWHYRDAPYRAPRAWDDWSGITRAATVAALEDHMDRVIHLRSPSQVRRWQQGL